MMCARLLAMVVCLLSFPLFSQITVAIDDFENTTGRFYLDEWEEKIPEFLKNELSRSAKLTIVERKHLKAILEEKALSLAGLTDTTAAREVGKMLGARYIITGTISEVSDRIRIDAHIINVASRRVVSEKVTAPDAKYLTDMVEVLGNNLRYQLTGEDRYLSEKSLKKYPTTLALLSTAGSLVATIWVHKTFTDRQEKYRSATSLPDFDPLYDSANRLNKARYVLAGVTGAAAFMTFYFWAKNLSPDKVLAGNPPVLPYFTSVHKGECSVGIHITF